MKIGKKTAVTRELTRQERNRRNNIKRLTVSFVVAFLLFIALVVIQSSILNQEEKKPVYQVIKDIPTGTKLAADNIDNYLQLKNVQLSLVPDGCIDDKELILNKFTNRAYKAKDIITTDGITDTEKMYKDSIVNPTELSFSVADTAAAVSGTLHEGDYVNIYGLRKNAFTESALASESDELILTDEYFTFMHVYIAEAYNGEGVRIGTDDTTGQKATMFTIILSEDDVVVFNEMLKNCDIRISKLLFDSDKTYLDFIKEINLEAGSFQQSQKAQERKTYFWDIDVNTGKYPEEGDTQVDDSAEQEAQEQLDAEAEAEAQAAAEAEAQAQAQAEEEAAAQQQAEAEAAAQAAAEALAAQQAAEQSGEGQ